MKRTVSFFLVLALFMPTVLPIKAIYTAKEVNAGDDTLQKMVENELYAIREMYTSLLSSEDDPQQRAKLTTIINNYNNIIYNHQHRDNIALLAETSAVVAKGAWHPVYSLAVEAVIAYFGTSGYLLAGELLAYAYNNTSTSVTYTPYWSAQSNYIVNCAGYRNLITLIRTKRNNGITSGNGSYEFPNSSASSVDKDFYYALHLCNYTFNTSRITVTDYYDFALNSDLNSIYDGVAETAVNTMYFAQLYGTIVPFHVLITFGY